MFNWEPDQVSIFLGVLQLCSSYGRAATENVVRYVRTQRIGRCQNVAYNVLNLCAQNTASPPSHAMNAMNERKI